MPESVVSIQAVMVVGVSIRFLITRGLFDVEPRVELAILPLPPLMCIDRFPVSDTAVLPSSAFSALSSQILFSTLISGGFGGGVGVCSGFFSVSVGAIIAIRRL